MEMKGHEIGTERGARNGAWLLFLQSQSELFPIQSINRDCNGSVPH